MDISRKFYPTKRYVQRLDLKSDEEAIQLYRKSILKNAIGRKLRWYLVVGILEMEIYISGNRLVMVVFLKILTDVSMDKLASLPRQKEWEHLKVKFQEREKMPLVKGYR